MLSEEEAAARRVHELQWQAASFRDFQTDAKGKLARALARLDRHCAAELKRLSTLQETADRMRQSVRSAERIAADAEREFRARFGHDPPTAEELDAAILYRAVMAYFSRDGPLRAK